ncbi:MAG: hypothetical protein HQL69_17045 [Magnetococcales bacterium]|nr:hypothetical protein [Magnetococcales bacterium]
MSNSPDSKFSIVNVDGLDNFILLYKDSEDTSNAVFKYPDLIKILVALDGRSSMEKKDFISKMPEMGVHVSVPALLSLVDINLTFSKLNEFGTYLADSVDISLVDTDVCIAYYHNDSAENARLFLVPEGLSNDRTSRMLAGDLDKNDFTAFLLSAYYDENDKEGLSLDELSDENFGLSDDVLKKWGL